MINEVVKSENGNDDDNEDENNKNKTALARMLDSTVCRLVQIRESAVERRS